MANRFELPPLSDNPTNKQQATAIMRWITATHEDAFTQESLITFLGSDSFQNIRSAFSVLAQDRMNKQQVKMELGTQVLNKTVDENTLSLVLFYRLEGMEPMEPNSISLAFRTPIQSEAIKINLPLTAYQSRSAQGRGGFWDKRGEPKIIAGEEISTITLENFRFIWLGIRWMSANLLNWDGDILMPEDDLNPPQLLFGLKT